jgi:hypothetical protein
MEKPEHFELADGYACYRPLGEVTLQQALNFVSMSINYARQQGIQRLLINVNGLTGFDPPNTVERFGIGGQMARAGQGAVKVALVAREELIDPKRFGLRVARNRGLVTEVFTMDAEALAWLLDSSPDANVACSNLE